MKQQQVLKKYTVCLCYFGKMFGSYLFVLSVHKP